jgi:hypothetical protein
MMAETSQVTFGLDLPNEWFELDVRPRTRDLTIGLLVENRLREQPELWRHRSELTKVLRRQARDAWEAGARYCACFIIAVENSIIPGAITVSVIPAPPGGANTDALAESLAVKEARDDDDTWSRRSIVILPKAGRAARREGVVDIPLPDGRTAVRSIIQQTFVPLADGRILLVGGASPALDLTEPLLELFDAVTSTLTIGEAS